MDFIYVLLLFCLTLNNSILFDKLTKIIMILKKLKRWLKISTLTIKNIKIKYYH